MAGNKRVALVGIATVAALFMATEVFADSSTDFNFSLGLGTETLLDDPTLEVGDTGYGNQTTYQMLQLKPDLSFGKFGIGLDLTVHFNINMTTDGSGVDIYLPDWVPSKAGKSFLDLYLPKISYARYGTKGDTLYAKLGSIEDGTLGNGFIMANYANTMFLPTTRLFGAALDIDGALFKFPYVGVESFVGNLAQFDVMGSRLFVRPLMITQLPILKNLQIGATYVTDTKPLLYDGDSSNDDSGDSVAVYGGDFRLPILGSKVLSLAAFGDYVLEPKDRWGSMVGVGGQLFGLFAYGAQLRVMSSSFIPSYFDASYDLYRDTKYTVVSTAEEDGVTSGWYANIGASLLSELLVFSASVDGPFAAIPTTASDNTADYPHLRGILTLADGLLGGFSFSGLYEKYYIGKADSFFKDLISAENAVIGAQINYKTGPAVLTMVYSLYYDDSVAGNFVVTSSLTTSIEF